MVGYWFLGGPMVGLFFAWWLVVVEVVRVKRCRGGKFGLDLELIFLVDERRSRGVEVVV